MAFVPKSRVVERQFENDSIGLTWDIPPTTAAPADPVKAIQAPVPVLGPDHGPIDAVTMGVMGLIVTLGLAALVGRALKRP